MKGIYIAKLDQQKLNFLLKSAIFDFVWTNSQNRQFLQKLKNKNIRIYYPIGIFSARTKSESKKYPAIFKSDEPMKLYAGWYAGVCPSNPVIRNRRLKQIASIFNSRYYDGIWLDAIRFPTYWETKKPEYLDTCYCSICQSEFKKSKLSWQDFRINQIESFVERVSRLKGGKTLGYFAVPETEACLKRVFAQPQGIFKNKTDFVSPMIYPQMIGKDVNWAANIVKLFQNEFNKNQFIPVIQLVKMPSDSKDRFGLGDFKKLGSKILKIGNIGYFMLDQVINRTEDYFGTA
jgi:hypothetical protein